MLPCPTLLDAHLKFCQVHFSVLVMRPPALASLDIEFLDDVDGNEVNVTASLCPGCVQQAVLITRATKKGMDLSGKQRCTKFFCNFMLATKNTDDRRRFPVKDFSGRPLLDLTVVDFMSFLFGQFLLVLCAVCKSFSKKIFFAAPSMKL